MEVMEIKRRGRPKGAVGKTKSEIKSERDSIFTDTPKQGPRKYKQEYFDIVTKIKTIWYYDLDKFDRGPFKTETIYPDNYVDPASDEAASNALLPITKRTWLNPANGKYVAYGRAVQLGLVTAKDRKK